MCIAVGLEGSSAEGGGYLGLHFKNRRRWWISDSGEVCGGEVDLQDVEDSTQ